MPLAPSPTRIGLDFDGRVTTVLVQPPQGGLIVEQIRVAGEQGAAERCAAAVAVALRLAQQSGKPLGELEVTYGSAATTQALVGRQLPKVVLVTTDGFTDVLRIGRQSLPSALATVPAQRTEVAVDPDLPTSWPAHALVPVVERLAADGTVVTALTEEELAALRQQVQQQGASAVAVMLLHSYKDNQHEQRIAEALTALGIPVVLSADVLPVPGEFERASAAFLAAVGAVAQTAEFTALQAALPQPGRVRKVQGDGSARLSPPPLRSLLSDIAAGLVAAHRTAAALDLPRFLSLSVRETVSAAAHHDGLLALTTRARLAGLPLSVPSLAVALRPVGGASLFSVAKGEPRLISSGTPLPSDTPVASLRDAALVAGHAFTPEADVLAAAQQRLDRLAESLHQTAAEAAATLLAIANTQLTEALWSMSVEYGQDPTDYPLLCYGGAAGLVAAEVAGRLGIHSVLIPPAAGLLGAYGALSAPVLRERARTIRLEASGAQQRGYLESTLRTLTEELRRDLLAEGQTEAAHLSGLQWFADLRYAGQAQSLTLPGIGEGGPAQDGTTDLVVRFHQEHQRRYGFTIGERPVELTAVRVRASIPVAAPGFAQLVQLAQEVSASPLVAADAAPLPEGVVAYSALEPEAAVSGPIVIYEPCACTFVPAGWSAQLDKHGAIWLRSAA